MKFDGVDVIRVMCLVIRGVPTVVLLIFRKLATSFRFDMVESSLGVVAGELTFFS